MNTNSHNFVDKTGHCINVTEAVWNNFVVYGVLQIRRIRNISLKRTTLKRCTTRITMNGGAGYCNSIKHTVYVYRTYSDSKLHLHIVYLNPVSNFAQQLTLTLQLS